jgi:selenoprotein W-related protein
LAEALLEEYNTQIDGLTLVPSGGGRFEVTVDNNQVYSKLATGRFPEFDEIKKAIK